MRNTSAAAPLIYRRIRERNAYRLLGNRPLILLLAVYDQSHVAGHLQTIGAQVNRQFPCITPRLNEHGGAIIPALELHPRFGNRKDTLRQCVKYPSRRGKDFPFWVFTVYFTRT